MTFPGIGEKTLSTGGARVFSRCVVWAFCVAIACCAQAMQAPGPVSPGSTVRVATKAARPARKRRTRAPRKKTAKPLSPSEAAAQPATVNLKDGKLTIDANNSELSQILQNVASMSGMTIEGLDKSTRVFGVFGPGNPHDVLTQLLEGSGYDFIMVGNEANDAPRQLLLTAQNNTAPSPTPVNAPPPTSDDRGDSQQPGFGMLRGNRNAPVPNAAPPAPPVNAQDAQDSADRLQRTTQRLEQMHEQQEQNAPR